MSKNSRKSEFRENTQQLTQEALKQDSDAGQSVSALTRRSFFTTSHTVGAGLGLLAVTGAPREARAQTSGGSAISSNFKAQPFRGATGFGSRVC